jgi:hypothetical protein
VANGCSDFPDVPGNAQELLVESMTDLTCKWEWQDGVGKLAAKPGTSDSAEEILYASTEAIATPCVTVL